MKTLVQLSVKIFQPVLQIYGDPEAADIVFTSGADIVVVGINITTQVKFTGNKASCSSTFIIVLQLSS